MNDNICVALDDLTPAEIDLFMDLSEGKLPLVKVGLELFLKHGPDLLFKIHDQYKRKIFLDLKLHDIPNTVAKAIRSLEGLPVDYLTVHLSGGEQMLVEAVQSANSHLPDTKILGVSFLTSLDFSELKRFYGFEDQAAFAKSFTSLCQTGLVAGVHGIVSSVAELEFVSALEKKLGLKAIKTTPGIRFAHELGGKAQNDQKRAFSPSQAVQKGADLLVIGRSLTKASSLSTALMELEKELATPSF